MGTGNLPDSTTVANGLVIDPADFLKVVSALNGEFVGRNTSGVATSGQSLGTILYPWGVGYFTSLNVGGSAVDLSGIVSPPNRIVSGATRSTSGQPQFLQANGAAATVTVLGAATNLVLEINSATATVSTDIDKTGLTTAPNSNNTCAINDAAFTDQAASKYFGEVDGAIPRITIDTVGSEISARVGQWITLKTDTSEYMFGFLKSATELVNVYRGYFFDSSLNPVVRETLVDDEVLTLMETGWIFVEDDGLTVDVTYKTPVYAYTAPTSPVATQYWYDITNATWKRYSGSAWVDVGRVPVGFCVINTSNCVATRSFDFYGDFKTENTIKCNVFSDEVVRSTYDSNSVSVYGTDLMFEKYPVVWNNTTDMETGSIGNDTEYYLYLDTLGQPKISTERPYDRTVDLRGLYHPYNNWLFICKAKTDGAADWINVISSGDSEGYTEGLNFDAVGLLIDASGVDEVTISYQSLTLRNAANEEKTFYNRTHVLTFSDHLQGTELASTWYSIWVDWDLNWKFVPDIEGTTDGTTTGYLVDSGNAFATYGVFKRAIAYNTTDYVETFATASVTSDGDDLAIDDQTAGFFTSGDTYKIHSLDPIGLGEGACHIGYVENDSGSDLANSGYSRPELQIVQRYKGDGTDYTLSGTGWTTTDAFAHFRQIMGFGMAPIWLMSGKAVGTTSSAAFTPDVTISGLEISNEIAFQSLGLHTSTNNIATARWSNTSDIIKAWANPNATGWYISFDDIYLAAKPSFLSRS